MNLQTEWEMEFFTMKKLTTVMLSAALTASVLLGGCGTQKLDPNASLVTVGGEQAVSTGYGNFVAKYNQAQYDQIYVSYFGSIDWTQETGDGKTYADSVKEQIMEDLERYYLSGLHASEYDVALSDEDQSNIEAAAKKFLEGNTDKAITQMGASEDYIVRYLQEQTIAQRVKDAVSAEAEVNITDDEAVQSTISYVFYATTTTDESGNTTDLDKTEITELRVSAEKLAGASDFDAEVEEQGVNAQSYSFTKAADAADDTVLGEDVIAAAKKLSDGQTSDVIEVEGKGFYVVQMKAVTDDEATATKRSNLEKDARNTYYNDKISEWKEAVDWKVDEKQWSKVTFDEYFSAAETTDDAAEETTTEE